MERVESAALRVDVKKRLAGFDLSLDWSAHGSITCLFGYTGSGKSLTLKMIAGLIKPDSGTITFGDKAFFDSDKRIDVTPQKRDIGYAFQNKMLFPHMTVYENILFGLNGKEINKENRIRDVIRILRLESLEDKYPHQISGGQQQRTAIARAVIRKPKLLLLDEPFSSLDHAVRKKMYKDLIYYQRHFNIPIILVTHDMDELHSLADWVVLYDEGKVVQAGTPAEVFSRPKSRVSARLVGTKNILDGEVISVNLGGVEISTEKMRLNAKCDVSVNAGDKVILCIRPENITIVDDVIEASSGLNTISGQVVDIIKNAETFDVFMSITGNTYDLELKVGSEEFFRKEVRIGKEITVSVDSDNIHLMLW